METNECTMYIRIGKVFYAKVYIDYLRRENICEVYVFCIFKWH